MNNLKEMMVALAIIYIAFITAIMNDQPVKAKVIEMPTMTIEGTVEITFEEETVITGSVVDIEMDELVITASR
jgi:hypothetical protein